MEFDFTEQRKSFHALWNDIVFHINTDSGRYTLPLIQLIGPKGCGKTRLAQEIARTYPNVLYLSFEGQTQEEALSLFQKMYLPDYAPLSDWKQTADAYMKEHASGYKLLIWEDEHNPIQAECNSAFSRYMREGSASIVFCEIGKEAMGIDDGIFTMGYRSLAEYCKLFSSYEKKDIVRLFGLTEGIPAVAKELETDKSYEENLRTLLAYDSAFSTYLPKLLCETFRAPDSYYPIIASIARGKHRLSEIAKDVGFPNNKCGTYLNALMQHGFVREEKNEPGAWARYYLANSYYTAWGRYVYGKRSLQLGKPDILLQTVKESIDKAVALPALQAACMRYMQEVPKYELRPVYSLTNPDADGIKKAVPVKFRDGTTIILDYYGSEDGESIFGIFPHDLDKRYTKEDYTRITKAISRYEGLNSAYIFLFSLYRFSDWIVHKAAHNDLLYAVTVERLKY